MKETIEELWHGNIIPQEDIVMLSKIAPLYKEKGSRQEPTVSNYLNGAMKNIIFITREKNSLTLLIPCSSVPSMVGNGVKPNTTYAPIMH